MGFYKDRRIIMNKRIISMLLVLVMLFSSISISEETVTVPEAEPTNEETVIITEDEAEPEAAQESAPEGSDEVSCGNGEAEEELKAEEPENTDDEDNVNEGEEAESAAEASSEETAPEQPEEENGQETEAEVPSEVTAENIEAETEEQPEEEVPEQPEGEEEETVPEAESENPADSTCKGDLSFVSGWVKLPYGTNLYETAATHEAFAYTAKAGIAYALSRVNAGADGDRMEIVFAGDEGIKTVYAKSGAVYPMTAEEIAAYSAEIENTDETVYNYVGEAAVSLLAIPVTLWNDTETEETENTETEEPIVTEPTENEEPVVTEPTETEEPVVTEPTEDEEPVVTEPTEDEEPVVTEPTETEEPIVTEPTEGEEPVVTEPTEDEEKPDNTEIPEIGEPIFIEPAFGELPMMLMMVSAPTPNYNPSAVKFNYSRLTMTVKDTLDLDYTVTGAPASCVGFAVSDTSVVSVSASGSVTAKTAGIAVVTVVAPNGLTDSVAITVLAAPTDILVNVDEVTVDENESTVVTTSFTGDVYGEVYLKSNSDDTIADTEYLGNGDFRIRGLLSGETVLTFAVDNKDNGNTYTVTLPVTVEPAAVTIAFNNPRATIGNNEKVDLEPVAYDGRGNVVETVFTFETSKKNYVAVSGDLIKGGYNGTSVITVTAENGCKAEISVKTVNSPDSVKLPSKTASLTVGESMQLTATLNKGSDGAVTWISNNTEAATVSENGTVTAVAPGKAQIKVLTYNNKYAICEFTIIEAATGINFPEASYTLKEGEKVNASVLFTPANAGGTVTYSVEDESIASVSADGTVTAILAGITRIHAVVHNYAQDMDYEAYADLTVKPNVYEIRLGTDRVTIGEGETISLAPVAYDRYGDVVDTTFSYKSSSTYYVKLIAPDSIKGNSTGSSTVTVTAANGVAVATKFTVKRAPSSLKLNQTSAKLVTGESLDLSYTMTSGADSTITWSVQPTGIVTVDQNGHVEAIGAGTATVTCSTFKSTVYGSCTVNVTESPETLTFAREEYEVKEGEIIMPDMVMDIPATNAPIVFSISYEDELPIAAVSGNNVKGGYSGYATLTATVHNVKENRDISATTTIKVVPGVCSITFRPDRAKIGYKETVDLMPKAYDARGNEIETAFTYKSSSTTLKIVAGGVYGNSSSGSATITVTAENGVSAAKKYSIASAPSSVKLNVTAANLTVGQTLDLIATTSFPEPLIIEWESSDKNILTVLDGHVTTVGTGSAAVAARTYNGKTATCKINVGSVIEDIAIAQSEYTLKEGEVITPEISLVPADAFGTVTLSVEDSDDEYEIAAVSGSSVKGITSGTATVTATVHEVISDTDISRTFTVTVLPAPCTIDVPENVVIGYKEIYDFAPVAYDARGNVVQSAFTLKAPSTYYIKAEGMKITGSNTGTSKVTVTAENGVNVIVPVKIVSAPSSITLNVSALNLQQGESEQLVPTITKNTHTTITYTTSDETVAVVDENGIVTAVGMGEAVITAITHNNKKATCKVFVGSAPEELALDSENYSVKEGTSVMPVISLLPAGSMGKVTLTPANGEENEFISIENGVIKGLVAGTTTVTASVYDVLGGRNIEKTFTVTVLPAPCRIEMSESIVIGYNEILNVNPIAYDAKDNVVETVFTLKASSTYYLKVNGMQIKGSDTGSTKLTVTAENGVNVVVPVKIVNAPSSITLNVSTLNLQQGESEQLVPTITKNTHTTINYTSSDETVAVVDENGIVTAVGMGEAVITAITHNNKKATCKVFVGPAPEELALDSENYSVKEGASVMPVISLLPAGSMGKVTLTPANGEDNEFISIENGVIKGLVAGTTTVTASVYDVMGDRNVEKTFTVTVLPAPCTIAVPENVIIGYNEIIDLAPVAYDARGDVVETTFTLKAASTYYIKVNGTQIKGSATGSTKVTVTAENGVSVVVPVKIVSSPSSVTLNQTSMTLQMGSSAVLTATLPKNTAGAVIFTSSDETVATVSEDGTVNTVGEGSAVITAMTYNGKKATCSVTVMGKVSAIAFERETVYIAPGSTAALKVNALPAGSYTALTYESSDYGMVSVDEAGNIQAHLPGEVTITAHGFSNESMSEISCSCTVVVKGDIERIETGYEDGVTMGSGETLYLYPVAYDMEGHIIESGYSYVTSSRYRVSVSGNKLKADDTGTATITVKATNGVSATVKVTVVNAPSKVTIPATMKLSLMESGVMDVTLPAKTHATYTFTSSDPTVLAIKEDGSFKAVGTGTAKVTIKTHNNKTSTCTVAVYDAPEAISFECADELFEGATSAITLHYEPEGSYSKPRFYVEGGESEILDVDENGVITGKFSGIAAIHAEVMNYVTGETVEAERSFNVLPAPATIEFCGERIGNAGKGETIDLVPVVRDARGNVLNETLALKSASTYYASVVSGTTSVKLNASGTAKITATAFNGVSNTVSFKISDAPTSIKLDASAYTVPVNGSVKLTSTANNTPNCGRTWESSDENVATVTEDGLVQALATGTAVITVRTYNGKTAKCTVNVLPEAEDISFDYEELIVGVGGTVTGQAVLPEGTAARIVYASRNPFVASVDPATGIVTGMKAGTTTITATIKNVTTGEHYTATYTIIVKPAPVTIRLLEERRTIGVGEVLELKAVAYDASGEVTSGSFTYATSSKGYVSLPQDGFIKGGSSTGTAKITIRAYNGVTLVESFKNVSAPTSIKLNTNAVTMSETDTFRLTYKFNSTTTTGAVTFTSDNEDVVTVDENGLVTAHDAGTATVTARSYNGKTNTCKFTILREPDGITLNKDELTLGETAVYALSYAFSEGHMGTVSFESANSDIASVDENGVITANLQGETTITVTTENHKTGISYHDTCFVTVTPQPVRIVILNERDAIGYGESMTLEIASYDAGGNRLDGDFTVSSSNSNYIKVTGNTIKGMRTGSATIKIVAYNDLTYTKSVKVTSAPSSVKLNASSAKLVIGAIAFDATATLNSTSVVSAITWESENPEVAAVDNNGHITGISAGTTRIKATTFNGKYAIMTVEVYNQPESVSFESEEISIGVGDTATPAYSFNENAYSTVTFSCPESGIATVDANGTITAKATGIAHITVTTVNGKTDTLTVNVVSAPGSVSFSETTVTIGIGQKLDVSELVVLPEGTAASCKFAVESSSIASVSGNIVTGKAKGSTRVKVTTYNGKTALLTVKVMYAPSSVKIAMVNKVLYEGDTPEFTITFPSGSTGAVTFESSDPAVLSFDNNGIGHANTMGTAKVKVTTHNNVSATISITVYKHVSGVAFNNEAVTLVHYDAHQLQYSVTPEIAYDTTVSFASSDPETVSVNASGMIEAKKVTSEPVIITVTTNDLGFTDTIAVTVTPVRVTGIELTSEEVTLEKNREATIGATILPVNADDKLIEWTSSNTSVATVDFTGKVTAVSDSGTAVITATTHDGSFAKSVTVSATKIHLKGAAAQYATYEIEHYAAGQLSCVMTPADADIASGVWTSSDESVLTVDQLGNIRAVNEGSAVVTCVITDTFGASFTCTTAVTVTPVHVTSVELSEQEMTLRVGRGKQVDLTVYPFNADDKSVVWAVNNAGFISITENEDGAFVIAGQKAGDVMITVTSNDGAKTAECLVHVLDALSVQPSSELPKTTVGNDIVFYIDVMNAIGNVSWNISVKKDDTVIATYTAYNAENGIRVENTQVGSYTIEATVTDSENDSATGIYSVEVSDRIEYTVNGIVFSYIISETSNGAVGAFIKLESCPEGTTSITVPESMNEAPVVRIDTEAFMGRTTLVNVAIPASCTEIGARAFKGCTSLSSITNY